jgi:hypothetical protein
VSMQLCSISVMGPTLCWTHDVPVVLPILDPFLPGIPHAPFFSKSGARRAEGSVTAVHVSESYVG